MIQKNLLKILFVEDIPSDIELAVMALRKDKLEFEYTAVCTRIDLLAALKAFKPDLIISDYMMPSFNGLEALKEAKAFDSNIPFILLTGSVNEETAVECIKEGAQDYVIKEHMTRLPFAVKEALEQVDINKEKRASELLLKENEEKLQSIFSAAPVGIGLVVNRVLIEVNDTFCNITGYTRRELIGKSSEILYSSGEEFLNAGKEKYRQIAEKGTGSVETKFKCKDGKIINVILSSTPLDNDNHLKGVTFTVLDITERKKAEDDLKETHRLINTLISNLHVLVYRCRNDKQYTMEFLSEGARELTGYSPSDLLHNRKLAYNDLVHNDDRDYIWKEIQKAVKSRKQYQITYRIVTKSGEIKWVWEKGEGLFQKNGELEFLEGFITDITQRMKMEEDLQKSQKLFETLAQTSPVGIFRTQPDGFTTYVNPKWLELSGLTTEEAIGFGWLKAVHPDDREKLETRWKSDVKSHISSVAEYRFLRSDGSIIWVMGNAVAELKENEILGYIGTITNITERKQAEEKIAESESKYRHLVTQSPDGIFIIDLSGKFISVNRAICENLKFTEEELLSMNLWDIVPEQYHSLHKHRLMTIINGENTSDNAEYEVNGKDGTLLSIEVMSSPYYKEKEIIGFQGIARNITERKRTEKALRQSEEKYRGIFENVQDVYYETLLTGEILEVSPSIVILSKGQYQMDDFIGKTMFDFYSDLKERQAILSELQTKGAVTDLEVNLKNRDGSIIPCSISAKLIFNPKKSSGVCTTSLTVKM
jgi:PAS domain S-box-containing protein